MSLVANVIAPLICIALITIGAKPAAAVDIRRPEVKEFINGYTIIKAETVEEAAEMAKGCPILFAPGGSVEVRPLVSPDFAE